MAKPGIGKRNHRDLTIATRTELSEMADKFSRLIDEVRRLEKSSHKNTNEISLTIAELVNHLAEATRHNNSIWDLITGGESATDTIEAQLSVIAERLEAHDEVIRLVRQMLQDRETEQLFGDIAK